ncbi:GLPGLI family protein, partial [Elizabethkingia meningoseptica]|nr:GLPGLI family protein [Elizabethkingia meningoseptica]
IDVPYSQYVKIYKSYRQDPTAQFKQMISSGIISNMKDTSGNPIDVNKMLKEREIKETERLKKDNNILELDLLK